MTATDIGPGDTIGVSQASSPTEIMIVSRQLEASGYIAARPIFAVLNVCGLG